MKRDEMTLSVQSAEHSQKGWVSNICGFSTTFSTLALWQNGKSHVIILSLMNFVKVIFPFFFFLNCFLLLNQLTQKSF